MALLNYSDFGGLLPSYSPRAAACASTTLNSGRITVLGKSLHRPLKRRCGRNTALSSKWIAGRLRPWHFLRKPHLTGHLCLFFLHRKTTEIATQPCAPAGVYWP